MSGIEQFLSWLNDPTIKTVLMFVGGLILKKWDKFVNKAIPIALLVLSALFAVLKALFPVLVPAAHAFTAQTVSLPLPAPHQPWWHYVLTVIVPPLVAVGFHGGGKATLAWLAGDRKTK